MGRNPFREVRARVCTGLRGEVVDVGFGTVLNAPYYPTEVTAVHAVEPSRPHQRLGSLHRGRRSAHGRGHRRGAPPEWRRLDAACSFGGLGTADAPRGPPSRTNTL